MPSRPVPPARLLPCRRCRHTLPIRQFHSSIICADEQPKPPSRREAARNTTYRSLDQLARSSPSASTQPRQVLRRIPSSAPSHQGPDGPPKVIYRRTGPAQAQSRTGNTSAGSAGARPGNPRDRTPRRGGNKNPRRRDKSDGGNGDADGDPSKTFTTHYELLSEAHGDEFASIEELQNYSQVMDFVQSYEDHKERAHQLKEYRDAPKGFGAKSPVQVQKMEDDLKEEAERFDALLPEALQHVIDTDEKYLPRHNPPDDSSVSHPQGAVGGVPIGHSGMGTLIEDRLRNLAQRTNMGWKDPKALAERLASGDFVKFRDLNERNEVMSLAEALEWKDGQDVRQQNVGFEPLGEDVKKSLVETLVKGHYEDPNDKELQGSFIKGIARLAWGNGTYSAENKQVLLDTIAEMMPQQQRTASAKGQPDNQKA